MTHFSHCVTDVAGGDTLIPLCHCWSWFVLQYCMTVTCAVLQGDATASGHPAQARAQVAGHDGELGEVDEQTF